MNMRAGRNERIDGAKCGRGGEYSASRLPRGEVWGVHPQSFDLALHLKAGNG